VAIGDLCFLSSKEHALPACVALRGGMENSCITYLQGREGARAGGGLNDTVSYSFVVYLTTS
jgi:hypothetical protein